MLLARLSSPPAHIPTVQRYLEFRPYLPATPLLPAGRIAQVTLLRFRRSKEGALRPNELAQAAVMGALCAAIEILVVDNDAQGSAREPIATLARAESDPPIRYIAEPRPGISHARNAGVAAAAGEFIPFLDDDEIASPHWLASFLTTARQFEADDAQLLGDPAPRLVGRICGPRSGQK